MRKEEKSVNKHKKIMNESRVVLVSLMIILVAVVFSMSFVIADPVGPSSVDWISNSTKASSGSYMINISGGYISTINLTANSQNTRWKAFIGNVTGKFSLDDAGGSTIYDWTLTSTGGEVYATRNSGAITWSNVSCATNAWLMMENGALGHLNTSADSINNTFVIDTHSLFLVGTHSITANSCPTLNTYVDNATQDSTFEEVALHASDSIVYAALLEDDSAGYNGKLYDFQMIVPDDAGTTDVTPYYLYVELS